MSVIPVSKITISRSAQRSKSSTSFTVTREESFTRKLNASFNTDEYLKDEYFDIRPKTDYTYAYSGSYCRSKVDKDVESPNMSRRRIRNRRTYGDLSEFGHSWTFEENRLTSTEHIMETDDELRDSDDDFSDSYSVKNDFTRSQVSHVPGMVLRSGSRLSSISDVIKNRDSRSFHSNETTSMPVCSKTCEYNRNQNERHRSCSVCSGSVSGSSSTCTLCSSASHYGGKRVRRILHSEFSDDELEKGSCEESEKKRYGLSGNTNPLTRATSVVSHMLGNVFVKIFQVWSTMTRTETQTFRQTHGQFLNSTTNAIDSESVYSKAYMCTDSSTVQSCSTISLASGDVYNVDDECKHVSGTLKHTPTNSSRLTWIHNLTSTQNRIGDGLDDELSDDDSNFSNRISDHYYEMSTLRPSIFSYFFECLYSVWLQVGKPVWSFLRRMYFYVYCFICFDLWLLARRRKCAYCVILLLPLLLLLIPLLLCGARQYGINLSSSYMKVRQVFLPLLGGKSQLSKFDTTHLDEKVKQIIVNLQRSNGPYLSALDIERIVKGVISEEFTVLKADLAHRINVAKGDMAAWQTDQKMKYASLDERTNEASAFLKELEKKFEDGITGTYRESKYDINLARDKIRLLEEQIHTLIADIAKLRMSQFEMLGEVKNCCHNDTYFTAVIKSQINDILSKIVAGGGGPDTETHNSFLWWLNSHYVKKKDWTGNLNNLKSDITKEVLRITKEQRLHNVYIQSDGSRGSDLNEEYVRLIVDEAIQKFNADKTGMADFALESIGGSILSIRCSETYHKKTALVSIFGIPLWYASNSPRTVIQPDVSPGQCWAFKGSRGYLVIQLATLLKPSGFTVEHISKLLSPAGNVDSALKDFAVYGLKNENDVAGIPLGNYSYSEDGQPVQFFPVQASKVDYFPVVELRIYSNHGNPDYTCLYRFRVHGTPYRK